MALVHGVADPYVRQVRAGAVEGLSGTCLDDLSVIFARAVVEWEAEHRGP